MYRSVVVVLFVTCLVVAGLAVGESQKATAPTIKPDPLDALLNELAKAVAELDAKKMENLFLPPDDTPAGKNRQAHLSELRKDWKRAKETGAKGGPLIQFKNTKKVIRTQMVISAPGGPKEGQTSEVEFTVAFTKEGWRIVSMETASVEPVRGK